VSSVGCKFFRITFPLNKLFDSSEPIPIMTAEDRGWQGEAFASILTNKLRSVHLCFLTDHIAPAIRGHSRSRSLSAALKSIYPILLGTGIGLLLTFAVVRMTSMVYTVRPNDPMTFLVVAILVGGFRSWHRTFQHAGPHGSIHCHPFE